MVLNLARIPSDSILESATLAEQNRNSILRFQAMGSVCRIVCPELKNLVEFFKEALEWVARFEKKYSRFIPDSLVSRINAKAGDREWIEVDGETETLLRLCEEAHFLTRGTFDPTALPLINLWDWKRPRSALPTDAEVRAALEKVGWRRFERAPGQVRLTQPGMSLDLGGIGKEYAVDRIVAMAKIRGIHNILVDFGRDIHAAGHPQDGRLFGILAWRIRKTPITAD